jgi:hypothetical protein
MNHVLGESGIRVNSHVWPSRSFGNTPHLVWHFSTELSRLLAPPAAQASTEGSMDLISTETVLQLALQKLSRSPIHLSETTYPPSPPVTHQ